MSQEHEHLPLGKDYFQVVRASAIVLDNLTREVLRDLSHQLVGLQASIGEEDGHITRVSADKDGLVLDFAIGADLGTELVRTVPLTDVVLKPWRRVQS
jgi:hypothetical protein